MFTGLVQAVGRVAHRRPRGESLRLDIRAPGWRHRPRPDLAQDSVPKGSVCIDGVSLTIAGLSAKGFHVALIPSTIKQTTLGLLRPGDSVNLEADLIAKTVVHWLRTLGPARRAAR